MKINKIKLKNIISNLIVFKKFNMGNWYNKFDISLIDAIKIKKTLKDIPKLLVYSNEYLDVTYNPKEIITEENTAENYQWEITDTGKLYKDIKKPVPLEVTFFIPSASKPSNLKLVFPNIIFGNRVIPINQAEIASILKQKIKIFVDSNIESEFKLNIDESTLIEKEYPCKIGLAKIFSTSKIIDDKKTYFVTRKQLRMKKPIIFNICGVDYNDDFDLNQLKVTIKYTYISSKIYKSSLITERTIIPNKSLNESESIFDIDPALCERAVYDNSKIDYDKPSPFSIKPEELEFKGGGIAHFSAFM